jgi:hypothetical protein
MNSNGVLITYLFKVDKTIPCPGKQILFWMIVSLWN